MRRVAPRAALAGSALATSVAACSLLHPLDGYERSRSDSRDADLAPDAPLDARTCDPARWPDRPLQDDGADDTGFVVAFYSFGLSQQPDASARSYGYDLDGVCSCPEPESCTPRPGMRPHCDAPRGIDNAGAVLLESFSGLAGQRSNFDDDLQKGNFGMLVRVRRYNGKANDREVEVSVFPSPGIAQPGATSDGGDDAGEGGARRVRPVWDGTDVWDVTPESVVSGIAPDYAARFTDPRAYVADYQLVTVVDFPLPLGFLVVDLRASVFTAKIVREGSSYRLDDATLAGRWSTRGLLTTLQEIKDPFQSGQYLCGSSATYLALKEQICATADLTSDPKQDGKGAPCDAISLAAAVSARPARLGPTFATSLTTPCGPSWTDECPR